MADPLLTLHQMFSPAFPVGAFSYSHGLETAIATGRVGDAADLRDWVSAALEHGAGWSDAVLIAQSAGGEDLSDLALALAVTSERRLETTAQGAAFAATVRDVWGVDVSDAPYPVAVGRAVAALGLPPGDAIRLYLQAFAATLVSVGVRLIPLGQTEGQRLVLALTPLCERLADAALLADLDDLGGFAPVTEIDAMRHEVLPSRVFRT
ncbi:MAG: urease accessory protein UreF [Rhodobacteraceae bacterium]|nr:MAG: urease accessory protein UreF [Paracoccaceae bacterium]